MTKRRLNLTREVLASLQPAELESVAGGSPISRPNPVCQTGGTTGVTSLAWSYCPTCGIACTYDCGETS